MDVQIFEVLHLSYIYFELVSISVKARMFKFLRFYIYNLC